MSNFNLTPEQKERLMKTCETLFRERYGSTMFARTLHNDYQIICNADIPSKDDFYVMDSDSNKPMRDLLEYLGYQYTIFGICLLDPRLAKA